MAKFSDSEREKKDSIKPAFGFFSKFAGNKTVSFDVMYSALDSIDAVAWADSRQ